jgi:hypothetical protein
MVFLIIDPHAFRSWEVAFDGFISPKRYLNHGDAVWGEDTADFAQSPSVIGDVFKNVRAPDEIVGIVLKRHVLNVDPMHNSWIHKIGSVILGATSLEPFLDLRFGSEMQNFIYLGRKGILQKDVSQPVTLRGPA